jgi:ketosteroid isomerase-like protein
MTDGPIDAETDTLTDTLTVALTNSLTAWMTAYRRAWESNDASDIGALFTDDAVYYKEPFSEPLRGRDAIIAMWLEHRDAPGTFTFTWKPLSVTDGLALVQGETIYASVSYSNLWVIRLSVDKNGDARATEFTEWWMDQSKPS